MSTLLKDGSTTSDPRLDRIYELDLRSLNFLVAHRVELLREHNPRSYTWSLTQWLDQGQQGACVAFGYSHELAARPVPTLGLSDSFARSLYHRVQREDPWPGGSYPNASPVYEGTSVLTGAKVLKDLGFYSSYDWAMNAREVADGIAYTGPSVLGLAWHAGMFTPDADGFIRATGAVQGGHCICAVGVKIVRKGWISRLLSSGWDNVDMEKSYIVLHNSWGRSWGQDGRAKLSLSDLDFLMRAQGEACFPHRVRNRIIAAGDF